MPMKIPAIALAFDASILNGLDMVGSYLVNIDKNG